MNTIDGIEVGVVREFGTSVLAMEEKVVDDSINCILWILESHKKARELISQGAK